MLVVTRWFQPSVKITVFVKWLSLSECSTFDLLTLNTKPRFEFSKVYGIHICLYAYDKNLHQSTDICNISIWFCVIQTKTSLAMVFWCSVTNFHLIWRQQSRPTKTKYIKFTLLLAEEPEHNIFFAERQKVSA